MRVVCAVWLSVVVWLVLPVAAGRAEVLGRVAGGRTLAGGPVWAGREAVWAEVSTDGALYVRASRPRSRVATFRRVGDGLGQGIVDLAASGQYVALVRRVLRPPPPEPPCDLGCPLGPARGPEPVSYEMWAGPAAGPLRRVMSRGRREQCAGALVPVDVEVVGSDVIVAEVPSSASCAVLRHRRVTGRITLLTPKGTRRVLSVFRPGTQPRRIAAAGKWLAWANSDSSSGSVAVFDRSRRRVVYRVAKSRFAFESFDLDEDGRLALVGNARHRHPCGPNLPVTIYRLAVASPTHPRPRLLQAHAGVASVAMAGGRLVSLGIEPPCDTSASLVVSGIAPASPARPIASPAECRPSFAHHDRPEFDGSRLLALSAEPPCQLSPRAGTAIMSLSTTRTTA